MTSYTIQARLTILVPVTVHGNTLAEAQDNFNNGEWVDFYMDPEATIEDYHMVRITVGNQIGLDTAPAKDLPLAIPAPTPETVVQELI